MWSLAVEVSYYAALPVLAYLLLRMRRTQWRPTRILVELAVVGAVAPAWLVIAAATDALPNSAGMWLPAHLACFAGGMALAVLHVVGARWHAHVTLPCAIVLFLVAATPLGGAILGPDPWWVPATKALLYAAFATLAVGTLVLGSSDRYARMLGNRLMVWLGEISYEIFLLHVVVMAVTMNVLLRWPLFTGSLAALYLTTLAMTIPLAWALHQVTRPSPARLKPVRVTRAPAMPARALDATPHPSPPATARQPCVPILQG
jgi:peptidoglycan/LPS O-acetylase OafA/YrhL